MQIGSDVNTSLYPPTFGGKCREKKQRHVKPAACFQQKLEWQNWQKTSFHKRSESFLDLKLGVYYNMPVLYIIEIKGNFTWVTFHS